MSAGEQGSLIVEIGFEIDESDLTRVVSQAEEALKGVLDLFTKLGDEEVNKVLGDLSSGSMGIMSSLSEEMTSLLRELMSQSTFLDERTRDMMRAIDEANRADLTLSNFKDNELWMPGLKEGAFTPLVSEDVSVSGMMSVVGDDVKGIFGQAPTFIKGIFMEAMLPLIESGVLKTGDADFAEMMASLPIRELLTNEQTRDDMIVLLQSMEASKMKSLEGAVEWTEPINRLIANLPQDIRDNMLLREAQTFSTDPKTGLTFKPEAFGFADGSLDVLGLGSLEMDDVASQMKRYIGAAWRTISKEDRAMLSEISPEFMKDALKGVTAKDIDGTLHVDAIIESTTTGPQSTELTAILSRSVNRVIERLVEKSDFEGDLIQGTTLLATGDVGADIVGKDYKKLREYYQIIGKLSRERERFDPESPEYGKHTAKIASLYAERDKIASREVGISSTGVIGFHEEMALQEEIPDLTVRRTGIFQMLNRQWTQFTGSGLASGDLSDFLQTEPHILEQMITQGLGGTKLDGAGDMILGAFDFMRSIFGDKVDSEQMRGLRDIPGGITEGPTMEELIRRSTKSEMPISIIDTRFDELSDTELVKDTRMSTSEVIDALEGLPTRTVRPIISGIESIIATRDRELIIKLGDMFRSIAEDIGPERRIAMLESASGKVNDVMKEIKTGG